MASPAMWSSTRASRYSWPTDVSRSQDGLSGVVPSRDLGGPALNASGRGSACEEAPCRNPGCKSGGACRTTAGPRFSGRTLRNADGARLQARRTSLSHQASRPSVAPELATRLPRPRREPGGLHMTCFSALCRTSMAHQAAEGGIGQQLPSDAAERPLAEAPVTVGARDDQVGPVLGGRFDECLGGRGTQGIVSDADG